MKKIGRKGRVIVIISSICGVLIMPTYFVCLYYYKNPNIIIELPYTSSDGSLGSMPRTEGADCNVLLLTSSNHASSFSFDTGTSGVCVELESSLWQQLNDEWNIREKKWLPTMPTYTSIGGPDIRTFNPFNIYRKADIPLSLVRGVNGNFGRISNNDIPIVKNVHISKSFCNQNLIGMVFLQDKIVEFKKNNVSFYDKVPTKYKRSIDMKKDRQRLFVLNNRYAIPLEVDGDINYYFIDTGTFESIRRPKSDAKKIEKKGHKLTTERDTIYSGNSSKKQNYLIDSFGTVKYGDKVLSNVKVRYVRGRSKYVVNPCNLFHEDFVLDFKNKKIWFKD